MKLHNSKKRTTSEALVVDDDASRPKSLLRCVLGWLVSVLSWIVVLIPGVLIIAYGVTGICRQQITGGKMRTVSYGDDAVGWGWIFVGLGFWALGKFCALKTGRPGFSVVGWGFAIAASGVGIWVCCRRYL